MSPGGDGGGDCGHAAAHAGYASGITVTAATRRHDDPVDVRAGEAFGGEAPSSSSHSGRYPWHRQTRPVRPWHRRGAQEEVSKLAAEDRQLRTERLPRPQTSIGVGSRAPRPDHRGGVEPCVWRGCRRDRADSRPERQVPSAVQHAAAAHGGRTQRRGEQLARSRSRSMEEVDPAVGPIDWGSSSGDLEEHHLPRPDQLARPGGEPRKMGRTRVPLSGDACQSASPAVDEAS